MVNRPFSAHCIIMTLSDICLYLSIMVFCDSSGSGEEGALNALWQKYENAIDKVPG